MPALLLAVLLTGPSAGRPHEPFLQLLQPGPGGQPGVWRRYRPQPGDLVLFRKDTLAMKTLYWLARCGEMTHVGIVVACPDGRPRLLEAPLTTPVVLCDLEQRLRQPEGLVLVRRRKAPLSHDQSQALTEFAIRQVGKGYPLSRAALLPLRRPIPGLRPVYATRHDLSCSRWICSELVTASLVSAGLLPPRGIKPCCVCPDDYRTDRHPDLSGGWEPAVFCILALEP